MRDGLLIYFLLKTFANRNTTIATMAMTNNTPDHTPALKIPPITSQLLKKQIRNAPRAINDFFMFSYV